MKSSRSRSTKTSSAGTARIARSPRVTIALVLDEVSDLCTCVARLSAHCDRTGTYGVIVTAGAATIDEATLGRRVRVVHAPADASRTELRHVAMQHAEGDIVLLEDVSCAALNDGEFTIRNLAERVRAAAPISEWRDILLAHGVADVSPARPSPRQLLRVEARPLREALAMPDAHHPA